VHGLNFKKAPHLMQMLALFHFSPAYVESIRWKLLSWITCFFEKGFDDLFGELNNKLRDIL